MARKYHVVIEDEAAADLEEIALYIGEHSIERSHNFIERLRTRIHTLKQLPFRFREHPRNDLFGEPTRRMPAEGYIIFYAVRGNIVHILGIIHAARDIM